jgi:hypothetical protein
LFVVATRGLCRICGELQDLTFEHIPPKAAFNRDPVRSISMKDWLGRDDLDYTGGRIQQRGMGDEVLCGRCNSFLGREYVLEYREWARWGMGVLGIAPPTARSVVGTIPRRRPLRFLKQCVAMVMGTNAPGFAAIHSALQKFVLDLNEKNLPDKYDVYLTLFRGPRARTSGVAGNIDLYSGTTRVMSEVAFPPFSILMTFDSPPPETAFGRINAFRQFDPDEVVDVRLELLIGEGHTPFPGDYRTRAEVERQAGEPRSAPRSKSVP